MNIIFFAEGLASLVDSIITNWLGPIYLLFVAVCALKFIKDQEFRKLFSYIGIATIVALLIFSGNALFGKGGRLNNAANSIIEKVGN